MKSGGVSASTRNILSVRCRSSLRRSREEVNETLFFLW